MNSQKGLEFLKVVANYMVRGGGFDGCLKQLQITAGGGGMCRAEFKVASEHLNQGGGLHGGFTATVVDVITTYGLMSLQNVPPGVSVDLHVSYLKGAKEGDHVIVEANTIKTGKNLAYLECILKHASDGSIIAKGTQTKYVGPPLKVPDYSREP